MTEGTKGFERLVMANRHLQIEGTVVAETELCASPVQASYNAVADAFGRCWCKWGRRTSHSSRPGLRHEKWSFKALHVWRWIRMKSCTCMTVGGFVNSRCIGNKLVAADSSRSTRCSRVREVDTLEKLRRELTADNPSRGVTLCA